ncbi:MAG: hypothetical protein NC041_07175 [Bacteroides sp.]|nr:hypothetical protein [Prevotella sp.]MCM1407079.1 hypothetical protein [Treponema brennaborense]MCM1470231.1 hypothetical protein [Bacteroides sp.]
MKLKTLLLLTLLLMLAMQLVFSQQKTESKPPSACDSGIDLNRNYTGSEVAHLIQIATEEAETAIDRAFDEGYKQGLIASAPETEYWRIKSAQAEAESKRLKRERWISVFGGFGAGFVLGGGIGFSIRLQN